NTDVSVPRRVIGQLPRGLRVERELPFAIQAEPLGPLQHRSRISLRFVQVAPWFQGNGGTPDRGVRNRPAQGSGAREQGSGKPEPRAARRSEALGAQIPDP